MKCRMIRETHSYGLRMYPHSYSRLVKNLGVVTIIPVCLGTVTDSHSFRTLPLGNQFQKNFCESIAH